LLQTQRVHQDCYLFSKIEFTAEILFGDETYKTAASIPQRARTARFDPQATRVRRNLCWAIAFLLLCHKRCLQLLSLLFPDAVISANHDQWRWLPHYGRRRRCRRWKLVRLEEGGGRVEVQVGTVIVDDPWGEVVAPKVFLSIA